VLFSCFLVSLTSRYFGQATHIPLGPLAPALVLVVCLVRTRDATSRAAATKALIARLRPAGMDAMVEVFWRAERWAPFGPSAKLSCRSMKRSP